MLASVNEVTRFSIDCLPQDTRAVQWYKMSASENGGINNNRHSIYPTSYFNCFTIKKKQQQKNNVF